MVITEIFRTQSNSSVKPVEFVSQDFLVTLIMGVFWLSGSAAWASGVSSVKYVANPDNFANTLDICRENKGCVTEFAGNFAGLNISIVSHLLWNCLYCQTGIFNIFRFPFHRFSVFWTSSCGPLICGSCIRKHRGSRGLPLESLELNRRRRSERCVRQNYILCGQYLSNDRWVFGCVTIQWPCLFFGFVFISYASADVPFTHSNPHIFPSFFSLIFRSSCHGNLEISRSSGCYALL